MKYASGVGDGDYTTIIKSIVKRLKAVLGDDKVLPILIKSSIPVDEKGEIEDAEYSIVDLERMMHGFVKEYGPITLMYCRMRAQKMALEEKLILPEILK